MRNGTAAGVLVIPDGFERDVLGGRQALQLPGVERFAQRPVGGQRGDHPLQVAILEALLAALFAGIDPKAVTEIKRIVQRLASSGIGVLITDHNVRETLGICGRAYIVSAGSVIASGSAEEILANPQVREVYLGQDFRL